MKRLQAYKFELRPNGAQRRKMFRFAGSGRWVWNEARRYQIANRQAGGKWLNYADMCELLPPWKADARYEWLSESPSHTLQQSLKDLERAYKGLFDKRTGFPKVKKRGKCRDSFRFPDAKQFRVDLGNSRLFLPKLGWVRYRSSQPVLGDPKNITVSRDGDKWFASIQTEREVEQPIAPTGPAAGIDLGVAHFATLFDGASRHIEPLNSFRSHEKALAKAQRAMNRKVRFSSNWRKAGKRVDKIHRRVRMVRLDYLHKLSTEIAKNHGVICIEDLKVSNMSRSASGSVESPGKNVRAKAGLNKSILDQGWGEFRRQLEYKAEWNGGQVITVSPAYTSQTCPDPECGHVAKENRPTQAKFACARPGCGFEANADVVGAMNIRRAGLARIACGDTAPAQGVLAQEPTEAISRRKLCPLMQ